MIFPLHFDLHFRKLHVFPIALKYNKKIQKQNKKEKEKKKSSQSLKIKLQFLRISK